MSRFLTNLFIVIVMGLSLSVIPINAKALDLDMATLKKNVEKPSDKPDKKAEALYAIMASTSQKTVLTNPNAIEFELSAKDLKLAFEDFKSHFTIEVMKDGTVYKRLTAKQLATALVPNADDPSRATISVPVRYQDLHLLSGRYTLKLVTSSDNLETLKGLEFMVMYLDDKVYSPALRETEKRVATIFYPDLDDQILIPLTKRLASEKGASKAVLAHLSADADAETGVRAILSPLYGVKPTLKGSVVTLDYQSADLASMTQAGDHALVFKAITETELYLPYVDMLEFKLDGTSTQKILNVQDTSAPVIESPSVNLHYAYINTSKNLFVYPVKTTVVDPAALFESLKKAPEMDLKKGSLFAAVPSDVDLLSSTLEDGILSIELSPSILKAYSGNVHYVNLMVDTITNTMNSIPEVDGVRILVSGQPIKTIGTVKIPEIVVDKPYINPVK